MSFGTTANVVLISKGSLAQAKVVSIANPHLSRKVMLVHEARTTSSKTHGLKRVPIPEKCSNGLVVKLKKCTVGHTGT
ncbi:MAG: hypothetical protein RID53_20375 [Coleofasciculus sp. B1-GNL1-01]|uniref:hypothetical protein n=1 Tax=Coleofasciculus sp. B1-GNL1-01 TaxID=3068484 RepID=UPI003304128C